MSSPLDAAIGAWPGSLPVAEEAAPAFLERLRAEGYYLVDEDLLAVALCRKREHRYKYPVPPCAGHRNEAAAIFAAITDRT